MNSHANSPTPIGSDPAREVAAEDLRDWSLEELQNFVTVALGAAGGAD